MASNAPAPKQEPLSMMEKLSPSAFVYRPSPSAAATGTPSSNADPKLVLVASWMDARDQHIAKYVARYQALYPGATILLVKNTQAQLRRRSKAVSEIRAAIPVIRETLNTASGPGSKEEPELLVHLFSNGGVAMVMHMYAEFRRQVEADGREEESALLPAHVTVFDSAPGRFEYGPGVAAVTVGLTPLMRVVLWPMVHAIMMVWWLLYVPWGRTDPLARNGLQHNDRTANGAEVRRAYVYSEDDALVDWRHVEDHAADAQREGFDVRLEKFSKSPHVSHARTDEQRYWRVVKEVWEGRD